MNTPTDIRNYILLVNLSSNLPPRVNIYHGNLYHGYQTGENSNQITNKKKIGKWTNL